MTMTTSGRLNPEITQVNKIKGDYPRFIGQVITCWDESNGRYMILAEEFTFRDRSGVFWNAPCMTII